MPIFNGSNAANVLTADDIPGVADTINGYGGEDTLNGRAGVDTINGGDGNDRLFGGDGNDALYGHSAADLVAGSGDIIATRIATGLNRTVFATAAPGVANTLFAVEAHTGKIQAINLTINAVTTFLDIPDDEIAQGNEQGFLGLAFHPDYETNGKFYVYATGADGTNRVFEYTHTAGDTNAETLATKKLVIEIPHPTFANHNGGWIGFKPNDTGANLYISSGDGGSGGDPDNNAQNKDSLLGKMLRINVDGDDFAATDRNYAIPADNPFVGQDGADEIWAIGLRNPWRASFDRATGDLYIGDVGQGTREEINFQLSNAAGGRNYGWKVKEGTLVYDGTIAGNPPPSSPALVNPIVDYGHDANGGFSVTGGYVYRGSGTGLKGAYIFADFVSGKIWSFRAVNGVAVDFIERTSQIVSATGPITGIASFAEDNAGNLYAVTLSGSVHRFTFGATSGDGDDLLDGGAGNDSLFGGRGNDILIGGTGGDMLNGGANFDSASYRNASAGVRAALDGSFASAGDAVGDRFVSIERIEGSPFADRLAGNAAGNAIFGGSGSDRLEGRGGNDWIRGGLGADVLAGNAGNDSFVFLARNEAGDTILDFISNAAGNNDDFRFLNAAFGTLGVGALLPGEFQSSLSATALTNSVRFFYETDTHILRFDPDGKAAQASIIIATLQAGADVALTDILII